MQSAEWMSCLPALISHTYEFVEWFDKTLGPRYKRPDDKLVYERLESIVIVSAEAAASFWYRASSRPDSTTGGVPVTPRRRWSDQGMRRDALTVPTQRICQGLYHIVSTEQLDSGNGMAGACVIYIMYDYEYTLGSR